MQRFHQLEELEEKYSECIEMLHEAQEELKNLRNRNCAVGTPRRFHPLGLYPMVRALQCCVNVRVCVYVQDARNSRVCLAGFPGWRD